MLKTAMNIVEKPFAGLSPVANGNPADGYFKNKTAR